MSKIPISYKAYDNWARIPMGICLCIGGSALLSGIFSGEASVLVLGILGIVLFFVFKAINYSIAKDEAEEKIETLQEYYKQYTSMEDIISDEYKND